jgi:hypothetical protein
MVPRKRARWAIAVVALVVAAAAGFAGYDIARHKFQKSSAPVSSAASAQAVLQEQAPAPVIINQNPRGAAPLPTSTDGSVLGQTQAGTVPAKNISSAAMHFSIDIPEDWAAVEKENDMVVTAADGKKFSIQEYVVPNGDTDSLRTFLAAQPNIQNITRAQANSLSGYMFTINSEYKEGFAAVQNGRLYYLLGSGVKDSLIAQTFKVI